MKKNALVSIEERHVDKIVAGEKKVELRRRRLNLSRDDFLWIYSKTPKCELVAVARVKKLDEDSPTALLKRYKGQFGISQSEFRAYFNGAKVGFAIVLGKVTVLPTPVPLDKLREKEKGFHPPQFGKYLATDGDLLPFLQRRARTARVR